MQTEIWTQIPVLVAQSCLTLCDPQTVACQPPLSMEFSRGEYWSGLPFPSPGDLPNPGVVPGSPTLQADSSWSEPQGEPQISLNLRDLVCLFCCPHSRWYQPNIPEKKQAFLIY